MAPERDPWLVLGVPRTSSLDVVRRAYLSLVRQHHPDRFPVGSPEYRVHEERMKEINQAYHAVLTQMGAPRPARPAPSGPTRRQESARRPYVHIDPATLKCRAHGRWAVIFCRVCNAPLCSRCDTSLSGLCAVHRRGR